MRSNRNTLTFELAVNLRHLCGFDRKMCIRDRVKRATIRMFLLLKFNSDYEKSKQKAGEEMCIRDRQIAVKTTDVAQVHSQLKGQRIAVGAHRLLPIIIPVSYTHLLLLP